MMKRTVSLILGTALLVNVLSDVSHASGQQHENIREETTDLKTVHTTPPTVQGTLDVFPAEVTSMIIKKAVEADIKVLSVLSRTSSFYKELLIHLIPSIHWRLISNITSKALRHYHISSSFLSKITKLEIRFDLWEAQDFAILSKMINLKTLDFSNNCYPFKADYFLKFPSLKKLNLMNNFLTKEDEERLRSRPNLTLTFDRQITIPQYRSDSNTIASGLPYWTGQRLRNHTSNEQ